MRSLWPMSLRERKPKEPCYHRQRINAFLVQKRYRDALQECELYFACSQKEEDRQQAIVQRYYGYTFFLLKDYSKAATELKKVPFMNGSDNVKCLACSNLGKTLVELARLSDARDAFEEALRFAQTPTERHIVRMHLRDMEGRTKTPAATPAPQLAVAK